MTDFGGNMLEQYSMYVIHIRLFDGV